MSSHVQVAVVNPFTENNGIQQQGSSLQVTCNQSFFQGEFDSILKFENCSEFFSKHLRKVFEGESTTVFLYGETGSGKTSLATKNLVQTCGEFLLEGNFVISLSCVLIESEKIFDLLQDENVNLSVASNEVMGIQLEAVRDAFVEDSKSLTKFIGKSQVRSAEIHSEGYPHHYASTLYVFSAFSTEPDSQGFLRRAQFTVVDLPGSEKSKRRGFRAVNPSLHILSSVLLKASKVSYSDSRLTQLLKYSLCDNANIVYLAMFPSISASLDTLKEVHRFRSVKTSAFQRKYSLENSAYSEKLLEEVRNLRNYISFAKGNEVSSIDSPVPLETVCQVIEELLRLKRKLESTFQKDYQTGFNFELDKQEVEFLMGKRGEELHSAIEFLRKRDLQNAGEHLQSLLPSQGRCPICTLKVPCKHYRTLEKVTRISTRVNSVSPVLNSQYADSIFGSKSVTPEMKDFQVRYKQRNGLEVLKSAQNSHSVSFSSKTYNKEHQKIKQLQKLEKYHEEKLKKEIDKIEKMLKDEQQEKLKKRKEEIKRKKHNEAQKRRIREYHELVEKRKEEYQKAMKEHEKKKKKKELKKKKYLEDQKAKITLYNKRKSDYNIILSNQISDLEKEITSNRNI